MPAPRPLRLALLTIALTCGSMAGCAADDTADPDDPREATTTAAAAGEPDLRVVTTVAPLTSIISSVAGPHVDVVGVVPEGVNSHTFEPPPSVAGDLAAADLVFINGLGLEDPTEELARANLAADATIVKLGDEVLPEAEWIFDFSFPEDGGKPNPHLWTNPPMVAAYAATVRDVLSEHDPDHAAAYAANHDRFVARVDALDAAVTTATATIPPDQRVLLTYHDAYAYFAAHYDWTVVGAIQPSDFGEPSAREVADLISQIREQEVPVVFGSEVFPSPVLEQISAESGATYVDDLRDDDLPGAPGDPEHSWLGLMRVNFVTMVEALGGDATALRAVDVSPTTDSRTTYPQ